MEIGVTAYASEKGNAALAGVLLAVMAGGLAVLALPWEPLLFAVWCVLAGVAMAPGLIIQSMLAARIARPDHATEAFTWTTSALLSGWESDWRRAAGARFLLGR